MSAELGQSSIYPEQWRAWMALCLEAHQEFEQRGNEAAYRLSLYALGFRRSEVDAEVGMHRQTREEIG